MKVTAYKCDYCNTLKYSDEVVGISMQQSTVPLESYPATLKPEESEVHHCMECYRKNVLVQAENMCRKIPIGEKKEIQLKEYTKQLYYAMKMYMFDKIKKIKTKHR